MPSFLITGSSRGLGLAFATELLKTPANKVIATARNTAGSAGLQALATKYTKNRLVLIDLDVTNPTSIKNAVVEAEKHLPDGLDNLISNAGIATDPLASFDNLDLDDLKKEVEFNTTTPINIIRGFLPLIRKGNAKKILVVTSQLGSIEIGFHMVNLSNAYSVAKAALNMLIRKWSPVLKSEGITAVLIHPGWVGDTDMGSSIADWVAQNAPDLRSVPEEESAEGCMKVLGKATLEDAGLFYNFDGTKIPW